MLHVSRMFKIFSRWIRMEPLRALQKSERELINIILGTTASQTRCVAALLLLCLCLAYHVQDPTTKDKP